MCLTLGACAERQPGQAQDHIGTPSATSHEQAATVSDSNKKPQENGSTEGQQATNSDDPNKKASLGTGAGAEKTSDPTSQTEDAATKSPKASPMDTLRKELSTVQSTIKELPTDVKQLKEEASTNYLYVIITFIIAIIGLAIAIINFVTIRSNFRDLTQRINRHRADIDNIKLHINNLLANNNRGASQANTDLLRLQQRVAALENQLLAIHRGTQQSTTPAAPSPKQPSQHAFFPAPAMGSQCAYFPKQLSSRESALFEATIIGSKAEFRPCVSFQDIISIDALRNAIEFQGASKNEARNMVITANGQAELRNNKWCVLRKVTIHLTK